MTCERYWRDGIVLVERGLDDPHRAGCMDCARAHASRQELIDALPLIGEGKSGDPDWQAKVWRRIDGESRPASRPWRWSLDGALIVACAIALWLGLGRKPPEAVAVAEPSGEIEQGDQPRRSAVGPEAAAVGDRLRVRVGATWEVWIYRNGRYLGRCQSELAAPGCIPDGDGVIARIELKAPVEYIAIAVGPPQPPQSRLSPPQRLDDALGELESQHITYRKFRANVH